MMAASVLRNWFILLVQFARRGGKLWTSIKCHQTFLACDSVSFLLNLIFKWLASGINKSFSMFIIFLSFRYLNHRVILRHLRHEVGSCIQRLLLLASYSAQFSVKATSNFSELLGSSWVFLLHPGGKGETWRRVTRNCMTCSMIWMLSKELCILP